MLPDLVHYDRMIVVTERDEVETLFLAGWIAPPDQEQPLSLGEWYEARDRLFPKARCITFDRVELETKTKRLVGLRLVRGVTHHKPTIPVSRERIA